jgi:2-polyprenyl-6-methoxyphenol hydroxylase-like FAD-dependent oxidoreductase
VTQVGPAAFPKIAVERLVELVGTRAPWFGERMDEILWSVEVVFQRRLATTFGRGRAWLAGDAAHVMFPIGMHSMNIGLGEAHRLAAVIGDRLRGPQPCGELEPYGPGWRDELSLLVAPQEELVARGGAVDWVRQRRGRIAECIPASGADLAELMRQLGLERPA